MPGPFQLRLILTVDAVERELVVHINPIEDPKGLIQEINYPDPFELAVDGLRNYTVWPLLHGMILPSDWAGLPEEWGGAFDTDTTGWLWGGSTNTRCLYMPWFGARRPDSGYLAILETPFDAAIHARHPKGGPTTIQPSMRPSLESLRYGRRIRYRFEAGLDYVGMCKRYRRYLQENNRFRSLKEKAAANPKVERLRGAIHVWGNVGPKDWHQIVQGEIKVEGDPIEYVLRGFDENMDRLDELRQKYQLDKVLLVGGAWSYAEGPSLAREFGPDWFPLPAGSGGWAKFAKFARLADSWGWIYAPYHNYIDLGFFPHRPTYNTENACWISPYGSLRVLLDKGIIKGQPSETPGAVPREINQTPQPMAAAAANYTHYWSWSNRWGGDRVCPQVAYDFVRRNVGEIRRNEVPLGGLYLDVTSIGPLGQCFHPSHRVSKEDHARWARKYFQYIASKGLIVGSEEPVDYATQELHFYAWSYYPRTQGQTRHPAGPEPFGPSIGIRVPLLSLVYHDSVIVPWSVRGDGLYPPQDEVEHFLDCLLTGSMPQTFSALHRPGGQLVIMAEMKNEAEIEAREQLLVNRMKVAAKLHEHIGFEAMINHQVLDKEGHHQRAVYGGGATVEINSRNGRYRITGVPGFTGDWVEVNLK